MIRCYQPFVSHALVMVWVLFLVLSSTQSVASSLRLSPVGLDLPSTQRAGTLSLMNTGSEPVHLQLRAFSWSQRNNVDHLEPAADLIVSPPATTLPPGATYTVRVARHDMTPLQQGRSYRVLIDELPKAMDPRTVSQGVAMVLRNSIPVFFSDPQAVAELRWEIRPSASGLQVEVHNQGGRQAKITGLSVQNASGKTWVVGQGLNAYVLAGAYRYFDVPVPASDRPSVGEPLRLLAKNGRLAIDESLVVQVR